LAGREMHGWLKWLFKLRRVVLMLRRGQLNYVLRGVYRRTRGNGGDLS